MTPKWSKTNVKLLSMDTDSLVPSIKTNNFYKYTARYVEKWFYISNYDKIKRKQPSPVGKNKLLQKLHNCTKDIWL